MAPIPLWIKYKHPLPITLHLGTPLADHSELLSDLLFLWAWAFCLGPSTNNTHLTKHDLHLLSPSAIKSENHLFGEAFANANVYARPTQSHYSSLLQHCPHHTEIPDLFRLHHPYVRLELNQRCRKGKPGLAQRGSHMLRSSSSPGWVEKPGMHRHGLLDPREPTTKTPSSAADSLPSRHRQRRTGCFTHNIQTRRTEEDGLACLLKQFQW